ncbi:MAG: hypothetical protein WC967_09405 [Balneolaceae bacterium]
MITGSKEFTLIPFLHDCFTPEKLFAISKAGYSRLPFCIDKDVSYTIFQDIINCLETDLGFSKHSEYEYITPYNLIIEIVRRDIHKYTIRGHSFYCVVSRKFKVDSETLNNLIKTLSTTNRVFQEDNLTFNRPFLV